MSNLLVLCWQPVLSWLLSYISIEMDITNGSNSHIHRFESTKPSCLRQHLLKVCSCCKANVTECVQSLATRMLNGSRSLAAQVRFLRPEPSTVNAFWQWSHCSLCLRRHPLGFFKCLLVKCPFALCNSCIWGISAPEPPHIRWHDLYVLFVTNTVINLTAYTGNDWAQCVAHVCSIHVQQHTWGDLLCSLLAMAKTVDSIQTHTTLASSTAESMDVAELVCSLAEWTCWAA